MIWCVEDDASILDIEVYTLQSTGFQAQGFADGGAFWSALESARELPELVVLDVMLPGVDGFTICKTVRAEKDIPILMVTARGEDVDKIRGLGFGADDYIGKPFRPRELVSRIRSVLRRCGKAQNIIELGDVTIDTAGGTVRKEGQELILSALEYRLLLVFANHKGNVLSRNQLLEEIWDVAGEFVNDNTLTVYIKRLREKIETDAANPTIIKTVRGLGYRAE